MWVYACIAVSSVSPWLRMVLHAGTVISRCAGPYLHGYVWSSMLVVISRCAGPYLHGYVWSSSAGTVISRCAGPYLHGYVWSSMLVQSYLGVLVLNLHVQSVLQRGGLL